MQASGQCLCGAVRFRAEDVQNAVYVCHCSKCLRWAGGPVLAVNVGSLAFDGEDQIGRFESSDWGQRGFCKHCGSNLFFRVKESNHYLVAMGSFDDQSRFQLVGEIYIDDKPPAYDFAGEHARLTGEQFRASLRQGTD